MASQYIENNRLPTARDALGNDSRAGLTSDVEALLAIFESIEQSIAGGAPAGNVRQAPMWTVAAEHRKSRGTAG